jgi:hypothetical protein
LPAGVKIPAITKVKAKRTPQSEAADAPEEESLDEQDDSYAASASQLSLAESDGAADDVLN